MRLTQTPQRPSAPPSGYALPVAGEALRIGHAGPDVIALQQKLNALGARPPLAVDGQFGPKTQAALQSLTGSSSIGAADVSQLSKPGASGTLARYPVHFHQGGDGFSPGAAPASLSTPAATEVAPTSQASAVSQRVVDNAFAENDSINPMKRGDDGHLKGWQHLQSVYEKTTGWRPSDKECQTITPGSGVKPGGSSWCGIWACHVLQQSGCNVKWDMTKGGMVGDVTHVLAPRFTSPSTYKAERQAFEQSIRPGDVVTLNGAQNHHAIVTRVNPDGTIETMDGNKPHVGPGKAKLSDVTTYYRANGE
jgi:peptidoglycan hydrolase-like protein with peptidoglycan-binding domain